jgi:hypothetical protein
MGEGSIEGIVAAQDTLLAWLAGGFGVPGAAADSSWRLVPGHGAVTTWAQVATDRGSLEALRTCARTTWSAGIDRATAGPWCAHAGFGAGNGAYGTWLFLDEWRRVEPPPGPQKRQP